MLPPIAVQIYCKRRHLRELVENRWTVDSGAAFEGCVAAAGRVWDPALDYYLESHLTDFDMNQLRALSDDIDDLIEVLS